VDDAADIVVALRRRFVRLTGPPSSDICYATTNRQAAVKQIAPMVDALIVVGETFSSNATRLAEVARAAGCPAVQLLPDASSLDWTMLGRCRSVGLTAAASTPDAAVSHIIERLAAAFELTLQDLNTVRESTVFKPVKITAAAVRPQPLS
jgi:4-hydroxy-3-methylbut-2-enyl diphosphate reductase